VITDRHFFSFRQVEDRVTLRKVAPYSRARRRDWNDKAETELARHTAA
jgi:hypothetical protein